MQKSPQITFAPVSLYTLRKQKRPIDNTNDEPPPILTKGSETDFEVGEEPPPPLLEAEMEIDGFFLFIRNKMISMNFKAILLEKAK